jgi:hypothetical protein
MAASSAGRSVTGPDAQPPLKALGKELQRPGRHVQLPHSPPPAESPVHETNVLGAALGTLTGLTAAAPTTRVRGPSFRTSPTAPAPRWPTSGPRLAGVVCTLDALIGLAVSAATVARLALPAVLVGCPAAIALGATDAVWMRIPARTTFSVAITTCALFLVPAVGTGKWSHLRPHYARWMLDSATSSGHTPLRIIEHMCATRGIREGRQPVSRFDVGPPNCSAGPVHSGGCPACSMRLAARGARP